MIGQTVSGYKILGKLFETDLGVVYSAEDTRQSRPVTFVVLPKAVALNRNAMQRFQACVTSSATLSHPNICDVREIGNHDGHPFIVMELLEGQTLGRRIAEKPLRIEEILDLGSQVLEALEAAHAKGVIYREITPANVFITRHGTAKLLDLELAKLIESRPPAVSKGPAIGGRGTPSPGDNDCPSAAYASPEQVRGEQLDARSDIFAVGAVLYQMATGTRAFQGGTYDAIAEEVLNRPVRPPARPVRKFPPGFWHAVNKALEKEKDLRYHSASEMLRDLHRLLRDSAPEDTGDRPAAVVRIARRVTHRRWIQATALIAVLIVPLWWYFTGRFRGSVRVTQFLSLPGHKDRPRFSPDGKQVAFEWDGVDGSNRDIYIKRSGSAEPFRLTSDPGDDEAPVWSPDGRQIAFVRESDGGAAIYTVPSEGGAERRLLRIRGPAYFLGEFMPAPTWSPDGKWLAFSQKSTDDGPVRVMLMSLDTREAKPFTFPPSGSPGDFWPEFSPDGQSVAFVRKMRVGVNDVWIQPTSRTEASRLTQKNYLSCAGPAWTSDGQGIVFSAALAGAYPRIWRVWVAGGTPEPFQGLGQNVGPPSVSENRIVYAQANGRGISIWRLPGSGAQATGRNPTQLIASSGDDTNPRYSPDGTRIAFESTRSGTNQIWVCSSDGSGQAQLTNLGGYCGAPGWSPDGNRIVFDSTASGNREVWAVESGGGTPRLMTKSAAQDTAPSFSRDGRWIYFSSDRTGRFQIWKMPSEGGAAVQVTFGGGFYAVESYSGSILYYSQRNRSGIWRVPTGGGEEARILNRQVNWTDWSLSREGLFYIARRARPVGEGFVIGYLQFEGSKVTEIYQAESPCLHGWLSASQDDRWLLYGEVPRWEVNLMLAENLPLKNPAFLRFPALLLGIHLPG
jgi:eukaryotic-like serine/threonine-protein kinase